LTLRHRQGTKKQDQSQQVLVKRKDRVRLVSVTSVAISKPSVAKADIAKK